MTTVNHAFIALYCYLTILCGVTFADLTLTILHTNDYHQRFEPINKNDGSCSESDQAKGECYGGIARLVTQVAEIRRTDPNVILLDAGDQFQGTTWFFVFKGATSSYFMNYLEYDCMSLGNHEFDNGVAGLVPFLNNATFPVISANIDATQEPEIDGLYTPSTILQIDGTQVGIVGYTYKDTPRTTPTGDLIFTDEVEAVRAEVEKLRSDGVDKIIALGHSGYSVDLEIAEQVEGVDVVIGGHSHSLLYTGVPPAPEDESAVEGPYPTVVKSANDPSVEVPVVTAYKFGKYLGYFQVTFDDDGHVLSWKDDSNPIILDNDVEEDEDALVELERWKTHLDSVTSEVIGQSLVLLDGSAQTCRLQECNLGNLITDAAVHHYKKLGRTDVNVIMWNSDSIGDSIHPGNVTVGDVMNVLPYGNTLDLLDLKGVHILEALEYSVAKYDGTTLLNSFLQTAGLRVVFDTRRPAYDRVVSAEILCHDCDVPEFTALDTDATYTIICNNYLASGGGGFEMIYENKMNQVTGDPEIDIISAYISTITPLYNGIENRVTFAEDSPCDISSSPDHFSSVILLIICMSAIFTMLVL
ncbi:5'-nucleotidase-like [Ptychodera flava]|uniref:5'-nucleotidase-like n=1 Tax=Ptychodera flava TaxID=63121 RepID=UPI003969EC35